MARGWRGGGVAGAGRRCVGDRGPGISSEMDLNAKYTCVCIQLVCVLARTCKGFGCSQCRRRLLHLHLHHGWRHMIYKGFVRTKSLEMHESEGLPGWAARAAEQRERQRERSGAQSRAVGRNRFLSSCPMMASLAPLVLQLLIY